MKGRDIIIIGIQPWDYAIGSNCKNIALEFSKQNRVLYVNQPLDRITRIRERKSPWVKKRLSIINKKEPSLVKEADNLWVYYPTHIAESINKLSPGRIYNKLSKYNGLRFGREIKETADQLGFKKPVLFNDSQMLLGMHVPQAVEIDFSIYYIRDNLISQPYFAKHGSYLEPELAKSVDLVVGNSTYLVNYLKPYNANAQMIGQGCDFSYFNLEKVGGIPKELENLAKPIVGYVGVLSTLRLDIPLLVKMAQSLPDVNFVLVGPEDEGFKRSDLHKMNNVIFTGPQKESELSSYVHHFDVAINPQVVNAMTIGNYPRKIDEYLAMGKPVVATQTETMEYFKEYVSLASSHDEYIQKIEELIDNDDPGMAKKRMDFAKSHSWENSVNLIYQAVEDSI